jgi:hypothetical protein
MSSRTTAGDMLFSIALAEGRYSDPKSLSRFDSQVYSQNGEDGIIAEIFQRIGLPDTPTFLEIGIQDGIQNNTRFLLEQGWNGVWIESDSVAVEKAFRSFSSFVADGRLRIVQRKVSSSNVSEVLDALRLPPVVDFLSLDIDQNTAQVWRGISKVCRVACIEYNAALPCSQQIEVPYDSEREWDGTRWYGASLATIAEIGETKKMCLVGCDLFGINAFLVHEAEVCDKFREPYTAAAHYEPHRFGSGQRAGHPPPKDARSWLTHVKGFPN